MAHTNDIGLMIRDAIELLDEVHCFDWDAPEPALAEVDTVAFACDASHGFSTLTIATSDGCHFKVIIVRDE